MDDNSSQPPFYSSAERLGILIISKACIIMSQAASEASGSGTGASNPSGKPPILEFTEVYPIEENVAVFAPNLEHPIEPIAAPKKYEGPPVALDAYLASRQAKFGSGTAEIGQVTYCIRIYA